MIKIENSETQKTPKDKDIIVYDTFADYQKDNPSYEPTETKEPRKDRPHYQRFNKRTSK